MKLLDKMAFWWLGKRGWIMYYTMIDGVYTESFGKTFKGWGEQ
jgi:hypothetical protein